MLIRMVITRSNYRIIRSCVHRVFLRTLPGTTKREARVINVRSGHLCYVRRFAIAVALAIAPIQLPGSASAGPWPERTVRFIAPTNPGSSLDIAARIYAERLAELWGKPVVTENRPGADGILAVQALQHANDGHSLLFSFPGIVTAVPLLHESLPYDPASDLVPITSTVYDFLCITVTSKLPLATLGDLVELVKSRPGNLNWTSPPGAPYLTFLEFQRRAGIAMTYVYYRSSPLPDLMADQIQLAISTVGTVLPLVRDGRIKLLAVMTPERNPAAPDLMTAIEAGHPELTVEAPLGLFGPKAMPMELRERIAADVRSIAKGPAIVQRLGDLGLVARASTPAEYAAKLAEQRAQWATLARAYGVRPQP
jgi:tripartite-type tricarboxylate transporter receptor subunit TctC